MKCNFQLMGGSPGLTHSVYKSRLHHRSPGQQDTAINLIKCCHQTRSQSSGGVVSGRISARVFSITIVTGIMALVGWHGLVALPAHLPVLARAVVNG